VDARFKEFFLIVKTGVRLTLSDSLNTNVYCGISKSDTNNYYYKDKPGAPGQIIILVVTR
jgi:hypothetical protein